MIYRDFNQNWFFCEDTRGDFCNSSFTTNRAPIQVDLPHDFIITKKRNPDIIGQYRTGYYPGGAGLYYKYLEVPEAWQDKRIVLEIGGAYMYTTVKVNSDVVAQHPNGYTSFHVDITDYLNIGKKNKISIHANDSVPNSRWYTGGGIYRDVRLLLGPKWHIAPWGTCVKTEWIRNGCAQLIIDITTNNVHALPQSGMLRVSILDHKSMVFSTQRYLTQEDSSKTTTFRVALTDAILWDLDNPHLYQVRVELLNDEEVLDQQEETFGIRTISVDPKNGFMLNGKSLKLKGGCVHHDCGILGAACYKDYEYRKIALHKKGGYNAIRCAHNPPSRYLLDACDSLGILVIDEAFDMWLRGKTINDYSMFFNDWWQRDLDSMVLRDRNHPSIIMWSIGNEIWERSGHKDGAKWAKRLADHIRKLDSSRFITSGIPAIWPTQEELEDSGFLDDEQPELNECNLNLNTPYSVKYWGELTAPYAQQLDVVGYNYLDDRYIQDGALFPQRVICGTESFAQSIDYIWELVEKLPYVIGDFCWASYDYIGEAGTGKVLYFDPDKKILNTRISHDSPFPWKLAMVSDFDICGFPRPQLAYRQIVWGSMQTYIAVHNPANYFKQEVLSFWGWPDCDNHYSYSGFEGQPIKVTVYSRSPVVVLTLNGKEIGRRDLKKEDRFKAEFDFNYEPGTLEAISFCDGKEISRQSLTSASDAVGFSLKSDSHICCSAEQSLCFVTVEVVDKNGIRVPTDSVVASAKVEGNAQLIAFGNAHPKTDESYSAGVFTAYKGQFLAIIKASDTPGNASLIVESAGLKTAEYQIIVK